MPQPTETEAEKNEQKFRLVAESMISGFVIANGAGKIVYQNRSLERILGYRDAEIIGASPILLKMEGDVANSGKTVGVNQNGLPMTDVQVVEMIGIRKNGETFPADVSPSSWEICGERFSAAIIRDVTARKESERKLQEYTREIEQTKTRREALLSSITDGIVATDPSGRITYVNKTVEQWSGLPAKEIIGRDLDEAIPIFDYRERRVAKEKRPAYIVIDDDRKGETSPVAAPTTFALINKKNGKKIYFAANAAPFVVGGETLGAVVVWRDVTLEKEIDKAKSEFISFASHQLRTPLTSIGLSVDMLLHHIGEKPTREQKKYLNIAMKSVKDMTCTIETLLNVSRIQMGTLVANVEPTDLSAFVDELVLNSSISIKERGVTVKKAYDQTIPAVAIDRRLMRIILENLISNALKYGPAKGTVLIETIKKGKNALIAVSDTGNGVPEDLKTKIFEKLFRVEPDARIKGTGLGLYIVKASVDQYGGRVWCESPSPRAFSDKEDSDRKGATFYVTIPLSGMRAQEQEEA